ncbi:aldo/keto reductase [Crateriforma spongiae]|uniref:aldo/keto reductase n=1 Tax=Crateriforma spongiae TaxID=2724528 RepID=UPI0039B0B189
MNHSDASSTDLVLADGSKLPKVGLGFWKIPGDQCDQVVSTAIDLGYRHFDCACDYGNEAEIGAAMSKQFSSGSINRDELWVTSKLWNTYHRREHVRLAVEKTLRDLQLDYLDLYHIHFPISLEFVPFEDRYPPAWFFDPDAKSPAMKPVQVPIRETWAAMEELVDAGLVRHIGICNFGVSLIRDLISDCRIRPSVLQVELHPYLTQNHLVRYAESENIAVTAFSPLGAKSYQPLGMAEASDSVLDHSVVQRIAEETGRSTAQVVLRWGVQRGTAVIPKSQQAAHLADNLNLFDFELTESQMKSISGLDQHRRFNDPAVFCEAAFNTYYPIFD